MVKVVSFSSRDCVLYLREEQAQDWYPDEEEYVKPEMKELQEIDTKTKPVKFVGYSVKTV